MEKVSFLDANIVRVLQKPKQEWMYHRKKVLGSKRFASFDKPVDWNVFNTKQYLFTHSTIVASVKLQSDGHTISDPCQQIVNANGNAWSNQVLAASFRTFVGKPNFYQHYQIQGFEKGIILDAILRPVTYVGSNGKTSEIYYVDLLIATNRKHKQLVDRIIKGQLSTLSMGCLKQDGLVTMYDGTYKKISDICVGDQVLTHKNNIKKVNRLFKKDVCDIPLYTIKANCLDTCLQLTGQHPVFIIKKQDICCKINKERPCKIGKYQKQCYYRQNSSCVNKRGQKYNCGIDKETYQYPMSFVNVSQLKKGDYLIKPFPIQEKDNTALTEQWCRLFGLYIGDGYLCWNTNRRTKQKKEPYAVGFSFNINEKYLYQQILQLMQTINKQANISFRQFKQKNAIYVIIHDKNLAISFLRNGYFGSHDKKFSEQIMLLPKQKQLKIISGMIDTDGCFYKKADTITWSTVSKQLFNQLHLMLLRNRIANCQRSIYRKPGKNGKLDGKYCSWQYSITISKNNNSTIPAVKNLNYGKQIVDVNEVSFFYKNYYLCPIKSVKKSLYTGTVYNIGVQDDQSYLYNNMAVHNCSASIVQCSYCGKKFKDDQQQCQHLKYHLGQYLQDANGRKVIVSQLIGVLDDNGKYVDGSCQFIQASWVQNPAFQGACLNYFIAQQDIKANQQAKKLASKKIDFSDFSSYFSASTLSQLRVADKYSYIAIQLMKQQLKKQEYLNIAKQVYRGV